MQCDRFFDCFRFLLLLILHSLNENKLSTCKWDSIVFRMVSLIAVKAPIVATYHSCNLFWRNTKSRVRARATIYVEFVPHRCIGVRDVAEQHLKMSWHFARRRRARVNVHYSNSSIRHCMHRNVVTMQKVLVFRMETSLSGNTPIELSANCCQLHAVARNCVSLEIEMRSKRRTCLFHFDFYMQNA